MYVIIEFEDNSVDFVPENWMLGRTSCFWPLKMAVRFRKIGRPPDDSWKMFKVRWLGTADTLSQASRRAKRAEFSDKLITDEEEPKRQRKAPERFIDATVVPQDTDSLTTNSVDEPITQSSPRPTTSEAASGFPQEPTTSEAASRFPQDIEEVETDKKNDVQSQQLVQKLKKRPENNIEGILEKMIELIVGLQKDMNLVKQMLISSDKRRPENMLADREVCQHLPIKTLDQIKDLNERLESSEDFKQRLIAFVSLWAGGMEAQECVHNLARRVFTRDVALRVNMTGRGSRHKMAIKNSALVDALYHAILKNKKNIPYNKFVSILGLWLRRTRDRKNT